MGKHRNWWTGLGIGIIVGATMLQIIHFAELNSQSLMAAGDEKKYTQQQLDAEVAKAAAEAGRQTAQATAGMSIPSASPSPTPSASPPASPSPAVDQERVVSLYINSGMDLNTVARSLKKLGVIEDAADFIDKALTIAKDIQPGSSRFTGKPTYKAIMAELTRVKND